MRKSRITLIFVLLLQPLFLFALRQPSYAYYTDMDASIVVGQSNFTSNSANGGGSVSASGLDSPRHAIIADGKLLTTEMNNERVLIWNTVPTKNGVPADVVIGQTSMSGSTFGPCQAGGQNLSLGDSGLLYVNGKLFIVDSAHNRILVYNSIPTSNGASADYVIGQPDLNTCTSGTAQNKLSSPTAIASDGTRLAITDSANNRVVIYNSIPTASGVSPDVVVGQPDFATVTVGTTQTKVNNPRGIALYNGKLIVGERGNFRVTIWNSIPTTNGAPADVALGQSNFTSASTSPPSTSSTSQPFFLHVDSKGRLYVADRPASRYLIWNSIPTSNAVPADIVIGQPDFITTTANNGGVTASSVGNSKGIFANDTQMVIVDQANNRVLIFNNVVKIPGLTLNNSPQLMGANGILTMKGNATTTSPYRINTVMYSVNGGPFWGATATDGGFDSVNEDYSISFDPTTNQPVDTSGVLIPGYTIRVNATNNNGDNIGNLLYFTPFTINGPDNFLSTTTAHPSFSFSVNKQRIILRDSLSKYQILVKQLGTDAWQPYIDDIPIDFRTMKGGKTNLQWQIYENQDTDNGVYETDKMYATYQDDSSKITVYSKINSLSGAYQWKVVASNDGGQTQETDTRILYVNASSSSFFPLAVLNISGLGNPSLNTYSLFEAKNSYITTDPAPIFYGIAYVGSKVSLTLTKQMCETDCKHTFTSTTNPDSRFGINVPFGVLTPGFSYQTKLSVTLGDWYNELPEFTLRIGNSQ